MLALLLEQTSSDGGFSNMGFQQRGTTDSIIS